MALSGAQWPPLFPTSTSLNDLEAGFRASLGRFLAALTAGGASYSISATLRPPERAYLMHWAWRIAREQYDARQVPAMAGVDNQWAHTRRDGRYDETASRTGAQAMVAAYGVVYRPSLTSRHTEGCAVDMDITWNGTLTIAGANGQNIGIASTPRDDGNTELHAVGAGYGVHKLASDPPHWSDYGH